MMAADYATVDASGKMTLVGIFSNIYVASFPSTHPLLFLAALMRPQRAERGVSKRLQVILVDESGEELIGLTRDFDVPLQGDLHFAVAFQMLPLVRAGRYEFRLYIDEIKMGEQPIEVMLLPSQEE